MSFDNNEFDIIKDFGVQYDEEKNSWYSEINNPKIYLLEKWISENNLDTYKIIVGKDAPTIRKKIYLNVPFLKIEEVKTEGASWDPYLELWWISPSSKSCPALVKYMFDYDKIKYRNAFNFIEKADKISKKKKKPKKRKFDLKKWQKQHPNTSFIK